MLLFSITRILLVLFGITFSDYGSYILVLNTIIFFEGISVVGVVTRIQSNKYTTFNHIYEMNLELLSIVYRFICASILVSILYFVYEFTLFYSLLLSFITISATVVIVGVSEICIQLGYPIISAILNVTKSFMLTLAILLLALGGVVDLALSLYVASMLLQIIFLAVFVKYKVSKNYAPKAETKLISDNGEWFKTSLIDGLNLLCNLLPTVLIAYSFGNSFVGLYNIARSAQTIVHSVLVSSWERALISEVSALTKLKITRPILIKYLHQIDLYFRPKVDVIIFAGVSLLASTTAIYYSYDLSLTPRLSQLDEILKAISLLLIYEFGILLIGIPVFAIFILNKEYEKIILFILFRISIYGFSYIYIQNFWYAFLIIILVEVLFYFVIAISLRLPLLYSRLKENKDCKTIILINFLTLLVFFAQAIGIYFR